MEAILVLLATCALGVLATKFGVDSGERIGSEERLASHGLVWERGLVGQPPARSR
jgi:hypothetical protein